MIEQKEAISEKVVLIGVITQHQDEIQSKEFLDELDFLTSTAGGNCRKKICAKARKTASKNFFRCW